MEVCLHTTEMEGVHLKLSGGAIVAFLRTSFAKHPL